MSPYRYFLRFWSGKLLYIIPSVLTLPRQTRSSSKSHRFTRNHNNLKNIYIRSFFISRTSSSLSNLSPSFPSSILQSPLTSLNMTVRWHLGVDLCGVVLHKKILKLTFCDSIDLIPRTKNKFWKLQYSSLKQFLLCGNEKCSAMNEMGMSEKSRQTVYLFNNSLTSVS